MEKATVKAKLVAENRDIMGYITYVFELLDAEDKARLSTKFIMTVRYPNWDASHLEIGDIGFLHCIEVIAGKDTYYKDGKSIPYNYSNIQFMKFVEIRKKINNTVTLD